MNNTRLIEIIKREIGKTESLDWRDKIDALYLLDLASKALPVRDNLKIIEVLSNLYQELSDEDYKETIKTVIQKYKRETRQLTNYDPVEDTVTLGEFLKSLGVPTEGVPEDKLLLKLTVGIDDGMGYTPNGFQNVVDSYPDEEAGDIKIWI